MPPLISRILPFSGLFLLLLAWMLTWFIVPPSSSSPLPDGTELSRITGVSIVQHPPRTFNKYKVSPSGSGAVARSAPLRAIIDNWCTFDGPVHIDASLPDALYDISVQAPQGENAWPLARQAFEQVFHLQFKEIDEPQNVWVLKYEKKDAKGLVPVQTAVLNWDQKSTASGTEYAVKAGTIQDLIAFFASDVEYPVVNETHLQGYFTFTLTMRGHSFESLNRSLEPLGLKLESARRMMPALHITNAPAPQVSPPSP